VPYAARWKCRTQNIAKNSPSAHHRTTLSSYIFATKAHIDNRTKLVKQQYLPTCPYNMANFGLLAAEICWRVWGTPANFNGFRVLAALTARQSSSGRQPNFAALNRGRHLYSTGRPSRLALAHISSYYVVWRHSNNDNLADVIGLLYTVYGREDYLTPLKVKAYRRPCILYTGVGA